MALVLHIKQINIENNMKHFKIYARVNGQYRILNKISDAQ